MSHITSFELLCACFAVMWKCRVYKLYVVLFVRVSYCSLLLSSDITLHFFAFYFLNRLTPNDPYMGRTAQLTSKCCIFYIYSTNIGTEYFKHALYSPFFLFKMQSKYFWKHSNIKFNKNPYSGDELFHADGSTNRQT